MSTLKDSGASVKIAASPEPALTPREASLQRLRAALLAAEGLWKHRQDIPKDGVEYQERLRTEWR